MLVLRHLHAHQKRTERELNICRIVSTFDCNGLTFHNTGNKRKLPCLSINEYDGEEFNKKICLNDVTTIFQSKKLKKNGLEDSQNAHKEDATSTRRSLSAISTETSDKYFFLGIADVNEHECLSYTAFKEKHEMSKTNILRYAEHLKANPPPMRKTQSGLSISKHSKNGLKSYPIRGKEIISKKNKLKQVYSKLGKSKLNKNNEKLKLSKSLLKKKNKWNFSGTINPCIKTEVFDEESEIGNGYGTCSPLTIVRHANAFETNLSSESNNVISKLPQKSMKPPKPAVEHLFKCSICTDSFVSQNTLTMHLKFDHRPRPTCSQCHKMFECRRKLLNHEANCSSAGSPVTQSLGGVIDFISPDEVFFCVKCENPFPSNEDLREHKILLNKRKPIALELTEETTTLSCSNKELWSICVKKIPSYFQSPLVEIDYNKCGYCGKSFQSLRRFNQHSVFCSSMKESLLARECEYCEKSFRDKATRDRHTIYCSKRTNGTSLLLNDLYACKMCNRVMSRLIDYNLHLRLEHDQRYCGKCKEMYSPVKEDGITHACKTQTRSMGKNSLLLKNTFFKRKKSKKIIRSLTSTRIKRKRKSIWDFGTSSEDSCGESIVDNIDIDTVKENIPDLENKSPNIIDLVDKSTNIADIVNKPTTISDIVNKTNNIADIVDKPATNADIVNKPTTIADIVNKTNNIADIVSLQTNIADIVTKPTNIFEMVNKSPIKPCNIPDIKPTNLLELADKPTSSSDIMEVSKNIMEVSKNIMEVSKNIMEVNQTILEMNVNENLIDNSNKKRLSRSSLKLVPDNEETTNSFHCIYCPDRNFKYRHGLEGHLRFRHNKVQCEYCGEIFRCSEMKHHDCLQTPAQTVVMNNPIDTAIDATIAVDSKDFDKTICITPKATEEVLSSEKSDSDITISITEKKNEEDVPSEKNEKNSNKTGSKTPSKTLKTANMTSSKEIIEIDLMKCWTKGQDVLEKSPKSKSSNFTCYKCEKTFKQKHLMIKHLVHHSKRNPYKCKYCRLLFKMPRQIDEHIQTEHYPHTYNQKKTHIESLIEKHGIMKCNLCINYYLGVADLKSHQKTDHDLMKNNTKNEVSMCYTSTPVEACSVCHKKNIPAKHTRKHKREKVCKECAEGLKSGIFQRLDKHIKLEENEVMKPLIPAAEACLFEFNFSSESCTEERVMTLEDAQASLQSLDVNYNAADTGKKIMINLNEPNIDKIKLRDTLAPPCKTSSNDLPKVNLDSDKNANLGLLKYNDYYLEAQKMSNTKENDDNIRILNTYQVYPCRECDVNFDSPVSLDHHITNTHKNETNHKTENRKECYPLIENTGVKAHQDRMLTGDASGKENSDQLYCRVDHDTTADIIPSPIGSPVFDPKQGGYVHYYPRPPHPNDYRLKYPADSPKWKKGCQNPDKRTGQCKGKCNCCNIKYFHTPQFMNPRMPKQKKYVFYPGEYPTDLLQKYLPHPPLISYPHNSEHMNHTFPPTHNFHHPRYPPSNLPHPPPPYLFEEFMQYQYRDSESGYRDPYNVEKYGGDKNRRPKPNIVEKAPNMMEKPTCTETVTKSSLLSASPLQAAQCDVTVVSELLKPLSPKSLDKSIQNGSRPKYTKSEIASKMTRLADTLGRKFGARFKKDAVPPSK